MLVIALMLGVALDRMGSLDALWTTPHGPILVAVTSVVVVWLSWLLSARLARRPVATPPDQQPLISSPRAIPDTLPSSPLSSAYVTLSNRQSILASSLSPPSFSPTLLDRRWTLNRPNPTTLVRATLTDAADPLSATVPHENDLVGAARLPVPPPPMRRVDLAVHPFGCDPYVDTVPRGALTLCEPLSPQIDSLWWRTFKTSVIDRYGGPLSFAVACEVHPSLVDQERWSDNHLGSGHDGIGGGDGAHAEPCVVVGKVITTGDSGTITRGQFLDLGGDRLEPHGYALRQWHTGMTYEGLWDRGSWIRGHVYFPPRTGDDDAVTHRSEGEPRKSDLDFSVAWRTWDAHGKSRGHVRHFGPPEARRTSMPRAQWPRRQWPIIYGRWVPMGPCAVCWCRFRNGDQYVQVADDHGSPTILYYYIDGLPRGQIIGNCLWTIVPAEAGSEYMGAVFYPTDTSSPQFEIMSRYVLSGRSAHAFSPAQQAAFVAAICAAKTC